jgi:hypothetical protein
MKTSGFLSHPIPTPDSSNPETSTINSYWFSCYYFTPLSTFFLLCLIFLLSWILSIDLLQVLDWKKKAC